MMELINCPYFTMRNFYFVILYILLIVAIIYILFDSYRLQLLSKFLYETHFSLIAFFDNEMLCKQSE